MANWLKKAIDIGGTATSLWHLLPAASQTAFTTVLTGVTAYFGYQELGIARAIFLATGVMAFGMSVVFFWARISQMLSTFQRLSVAAFVVPNSSIDPIKAKVNGINVQCIIRNDSQQLMFYKIRRMHMLVESKGPKDNSIDRNVMTISPNGGTAFLNFATVEEIPFASKKDKDRKVTCKMDIEVEYGPAIEEIKFLIHCEAELFVVFNPIPNSKEFRVDSASIFRRYEHTRM